jgi:hypothetical protein
MPRAFALLLALAACDPLADARLVDLSLEERVELCEDLELPRKEVTCGDRTVEAGLAADACEAATLERSPVSPGCTATVEEYRACLQDLYDDPCVSGHASCATLNGCFAIDDGAD